MTIDYVSQMQERGLWAVVFSQISIAKHWDDSGVKSEKNYETPGPNFDEMYVRVYTIT